MRSSATPWTANISFSVNTSVEAATATAMATAKATGVRSGGRATSSVPYRPTSEDAAGDGQPGDSEHAHERQPARTFTALQKSLSDVISNVR